MFMVSLHYTISHMRRGVGTLAPPFICGVLDFNWLWIEDEEASVVMTVIAMTHNDNTFIPIQMLMLMETSTLKGQSWYVY